MRRTRKPWYRKQTGEWYASFGGEQHPLGIRGDQEATKDAAEDAFHRFMVGQTGKPPEKQALTAADVCTLFLDTSKADNAPSTYEWYRHFVESFSRKYGRVRIRDLEPFHVTNWIAGHRWNQSTRRAAITCVKRAFNWAADEGYIAASPFKKVKKPAVLRRDVILAPGQGEALRKASWGQCFRDFLLALEETGCRPGEIAKVTADMVDLDAGVWVLPEHKTRHKTGEPRTVYLTGVMIALSRKLMVQDPTGPIFRNRFKKPWTRNAIRLRFRQLRRKLRLKGIVAYTVRHTYATEALVNGVDPFSLSELMSTSFKMIQEHYAHLAKKGDHLRRAAEKARRPA